MTKEQLSALLSLFAAIVIVAASFWQWFDVTFGGDLPLRRWARWMLAAVLVLLVAAVVLLVASV